MNITDIITKGRVTYLHSLGCDSHRRQLTILCVQEPDWSIIVRSVLFRGIGQYSDVWDEEEIYGDYDADAIIGLRTYAEDDRTRYVLRTEAREIIFTTALPPEIIEHCAGQAK